MAYAPTVNNQSGQILAQGISAAGNNIADVLAQLGKKREEGRAADSAMDMLISMAPDALPKGQDGQVDAAFLDKFMGAPLKAKQQMLGVVTSQLLTPRDQAQIGLIGAQTGLVNAQAGQYGQAQAAAQAAAQGKADAKTRLSKWSNQRRPQKPVNAIPGTQGPVEPALPQASKPVVDLPPLPDMSLTPN
jgi:hypothetical protein